MKVKIKLRQLVLAVLICEGAGLVGSVFTFDSIKSWYPTLVKPWFNPPSWVFGPVWTGLYFLMGISLYLIWKGKRKPLKWFWIQLGLNSLWSVIFFGLHQPLLALGEIGLLWMSIFLTIREFKRVDKRAALLLLPYLAWVSFATVLNFSLVVLNW